MTQINENALGGIRALRAAGVPLFAAAPTAGPGVFIYPRGWQDTPAGQPLEGSAPQGFALCAVMGHAFDVIDLDLDHADAVPEENVLATGIYVCGRATTPSGGVHLFVPPLGLGNKINVGKMHLDIKGERGFVFIAPTPKPKGVYTWTKFPELPPIGAREACEGFRQWVIEETAPKAESWGGPDADTADVVNRTDSYALAALEAEAREVAYAPEGGRNHALNKAAFKVGTLVGAGALEERLARSALMQAALYVGLPQREALATIRSGLKAGMDNPRVLVTAA